MRKASIFQDLNYLDNKPSISILLESDFTKEIRILFRQNQVMKAHKTPFPIVVEVVEGAIDFGVEGEIHYLQKGDLISLEGSVLHDLKAISDSIVKLTLAKNDTTSRVKDVANQ